MIRNKTLLCLYAFLSLYPCLKAQQEYPADYFRAPLDIPMYLSGNFGELRTNHFHAGIDIKTLGVTGLKVYASAEGFISRIKIETGGYGNTLYINHPNGYTTVYGHLDRFREDIAEYVRKIQYEREQHTLDIFTGREEWPVSKGELIAYSGSTGNTSGPHLHFEIRDSGPQEPINALLFGFDIEDHMPPKILSLYVYPKGDGGLVNNSRLKQRFEVSGDNGEYRLKSSDTIRVDGPIGYGIEAYDYLDGANNRCGLYSVRMLVDDQLKYHWEMKQFSFNETRYINSYIDYEEKGRNKRTVQKAFLDPNNKLGLYEFTDQGGILDFSENRAFHIAFILDDAYGNRSTIAFTVLGGSRSALNRKNEQEAYTEIFSCMNPNEFNRARLELQIPEGALYDDLNFNFARTEMLPGTYAPVYHLHNPYTPLHMACRLAIEPEGLPDSLKGKALIGMVSDEGEIESVGGQWKDGRVITEILSFGNFTVALDTLPPKIIPLVQNGRTDMSREQSVRFRVTDDLSGIKSYEGYIDNRWALFEYDPKNDLVSYTFDASRINRGSQHELELYITDNKENISYYYTEFYW